MKKNQKRKGKNPGKQKILNPKKTSIKQTNKTTRGGKKKKQDKNNMLKSTEIENQK